jgi:uncharacterized OB-fold protein
VFIPQEFCTSCLSSNLHWVTSQGIGSVVTFTVVWRPQTPAFSVPYAIAVVRLDEGYEMITNVVNCETSKVEIGAVVKVCFVDIDEAITLPCFELVEGAVAH